MFKKILIANRGEIAVRVIRACRDLGIGTVAVYSDVDRESFHVILADEAYNIGPAPSIESYLNIDRIVDAVKKSGAEAVHPGYGFLSENTEFAEALARNGITFIGPTAENIRTMGDKITARQTMQAADVPVVPGSAGLIDSVEEASTIAEKIGLPIIIKATAGGGGKGMRVVHSMEDLPSAFRAARSEGLNYFKDDRVYIERFVANPKHIEIQVFGDKHGNVVHLFERECSAQRRNQKIIEECPSPSVPPEVREKMGNVAVRAAKSIGYIGAGTFEFIFDNNTKDFYFMEMNTRLQVEHPITEMVTGVDLVKEQILVAAGNKLSFSQDQIQQKGHAIEARICAEDPVTFMPNPGKIRLCRVPTGPFIRVDTYVYPGFKIPIHYDPMIAKVIAWGHTRQEAIVRLSRALKEFALTGIKSNITLHKAIMDHPKFVDGSYTTQFIETQLRSKKGTFFKYVDDKIFLIAAAISAYNDRKTKDVSDITLASRWKDVGRMKSLR